MPSPSTNFLPVHRLFITCLATTFLAFIVWAAVVNIDIVVNVSGKLVPASFVRVAQAAEDGVVRVVSVQDGQTVARGATLVEMDPVYAQEDVRSAESQRDRVKLQLARIDAELEGQAFAPAIGTPEARAAALAEFTLRKQAFSAAMAEATAAQTKAASDGSTVSERLRQAEQMFPLVNKQAQQQEALRDQGLRCCLLRTRPPLAWLLTSDYIWVQKTSNALVPSERQGRKSAIST